MILARLFSDLGSAAWLMGGAAGAAARGRAGPGFAPALLAFVWIPLPLIFVTAVMIGLIMGLPMADLARQVRAEQTVGVTMSVLVARELAPIIVAVFAAGWISAGLAVRLAERGQAVLAPSVLAVLLAAPMHLVATLMGIWLTIGVLMQDGPIIPWHVYFEITMGPSIYRGMGEGVIKAILFTQVAAFVAAAVGSRQAGPVARVGAAFAAGLIAVLGAVALWTWLR